MEIRDRNGEKRQVSDALYAEGLKGWEALARERGEDYAREVYAQLGVSGPNDLTEAGQREIKEEARESRKPVVDLEEAAALQAAGVTGAELAEYEAYSAAREAVDDFVGGKPEDEDEDEIHSVFSEYEIGPDGKVMTKAEAEAVRKAGEFAAAKSRGHGGLVASFAAYRASKWSPAEGLTVNDRGELVADEGPEPGPNEKYELADENDAEHTMVTEDGKVLRQIRAKRDIVLEDGTVVKKGEWGGFVESEENLSFSDNSWIAGDAIVQEAARVSDGAIVKDEAVVAGWARVTGPDTVVEGEAFVDDRAVVADGATVKDKAVVKAFGFVSDGSAVEGAAIVGGVSRLVGEKVKDVALGISEADDRKVEARLAEEAKLTPAKLAKKNMKAFEDSVYGDIASVDLDAYDHKGWSVSRPAKAAPAVQADKAAVPEQAAEKAKAAEAAPPAKKGKDQSGPKTSKYSGFADHAVAFDDASPQDRSMSMG